MAGVAAASAQPRFSDPLPRCFLGGGLLPAIPLCHLRVGICRSCAPRQAGSMVLALTVTVDGVPHIWGPCAELLSCISIWGS